MLYSMHELSVGFGLLRSYTAKNSSIKLVRKKLFGILSLSVELDWKIQKCVV